MRKAVETWQDLGFGQFELRYLRDKNGRFNPDAQRQMNEEVMALYRSEGVNPAGGCLPVLVQLPIFFAFYQLLSTAVELWQAPWQ